MAVHTYHAYMIPVLKVLARDGAVWKRTDLVEEVAKLTGLSEEDRIVLIPAGNQPLYKNRISWAMTYLKKAAALTSPAKAHFQITDFGRTMLEKHPEHVTVAQLRKESLGIAPGASWEAVDVRSGDVEKQETETTLDPVEQIETGVARNDAAVAADLLTRLHGSDPEFFEQAVLDLLIAMGYGGTQGKATRTQLSNDGGIDGIIDQDALGLSRIYVQAKRYEPSSSIGRPAIQGFVGALQGAQADRGVFMTTARFSSGAVEYANAVPSRVVLIDGERLTKLMIRYGVGVQVKRTVAIVEVDEDYFE